MKHRAMLQDWRIQWVQKWGCTGTGVSLSRALKSFLKKSDLVINHPWNMKKIHQATEKAALYCLFPRSYASIFLINWILLLSKHLWTLLHGRKRASSRWLRTSGPRVATACLFHHFWTSKGWEEQRGEQQDFGWRDCFWFGRRNPRFLNFQ